MSLAGLEPAPDVARLAHLLERLVAIDTQNPPGRETEAAALLAPSSWRPSASLSR